MFVDYDSIIYLLILKTNVIFPDFECLWLGAATY